LPTLIELQNITKAVNRAKDGSTVAEVRTTFDKAAQIDDIKSISGKDLEDHQGRRQNRGGVCLHP
jgi:hypothetical protein